MYCTIQNIIDYIGQPELQRLSNDYDGDNLINDTLVNTFISDNSNLIDSYLRDKFTLPITDAILTKICVMLTICDLQERRFSLEEVSTITTRRKQAMQMLLDIKSGTMNLTTIVEPKEDTASVLCITPAKEFTTEKMRQYDSGYSNRRLYS